MDKHVGLDMMAQLMAIKTEVFNVTHAKYIMDSEKFPVVLRNHLRIYYKNKYNGNQVDVVYKPSKKQIEGPPIGRLYASRGLSLQSLEKDVRAFLAQDYYHDIDIRNAQPCIALQACEKKNWPVEHLKKYVEDRDDVLKGIMDDYKVTYADAKELVLRLMFLGDVAAWEADHQVYFENNGDMTNKDKPVPSSARFLKKLSGEISDIAEKIWADPDCERIKQLVNITKKQESGRNKRSSAMAYFFQDIENRIIMAMDEALRLNGRAMEVLIFDGGLVRKKDKDEAEFPPDILRKCEQHIFDTTGYMVRLEQKPLKSTIKMDDEQLQKTMVPRHVTVDDGYAAEQFVRAMEGLVKKCMEEVFYFDIDTGVWSSKKSVARKHARRLRKQLIFYQDVDSGEGTREFNYSCKEANFDNMLKWVPVICADDDFIEMRADSSRGKLLFNDGIYDFETDTFTPGFDPNIVFFYKIHRNFPVVRDPDIMARVHKILFEDPFMPGDSDVVTYLKIALARGIAGDYRAKKIYFCVGEANAGKGVLSGALAAAFGRYIGTFNGDGLFANNGSQDTAKQRSWVMSIMNKRIAISNEMQMNRSIDGNILKSLVSGGDEMLARTNHKDEQVVVNRSTMFCFVNDIPRIKPYDSAIEARVTCPEFKCTFVDEPMLPHERRTDKDVKDLFNTDNAYKDALVCILIDAYKQFKNQGHVIPKAVRKATEEWVGGESSIRNILEKGYEITGNADDKELAENIVRVIQAEMTISGTKIGREIAKLGIQKKNIKQGRVTKVFYLGIKVKVDDTIIM
jgi:phage/plasmid-associated DNA primase